MNRLKALAIVVLIAFLGGGRPNERRLGADITHLSLFARPLAALAAYYLLVNPAKAYPVSERVVSPQSESQSLISEDESKNHQRISGIHNNRHDLWSFNHPDIQVKGPSFLSGVLQFGKKICTNIGRGKERIEELFGNFLDSAYSGVDDGAEERAEMARKLERARKRRERARQRHKNRNKRVKSVE